MADLSSYLYVGDRGRFQPDMDEADIIVTVWRRNGMIVWCPGMKVGHYEDTKRMTRSYLARFYTNWTRT